MKVVKCSIARRILSAMIDFLVAAVMFFVLYAFVMNPIINNTTDYKTTNSALYTKLSYTGLYDYDSYGGSIAIITPEITPTDSTKVYEFYDTPVSTYYTQNSALSVFNAQKEASGYFTLDGDSYVLKENVSVKNLTNFYVSSIKTAVSNYFYTNEEIVELRTKIKTYENVMVYIPLITSAVVLLGVLPVVKKNGKTVGKEIFNIKVGSYTSGTILSYKQKLIRQLVVVLPICLVALFALLTSLSTVVILALFLGLGIIFLVPTIATKKNRSIDDLASKTFLYYYDDPKDIEDFDPEDIIEVNLEEKVTKVNISEPSKTIDPDNYFDESTLKNNQKD